MDPLTLMLIIGAVTYVTAAPGRTSLRATRGSAHAARSAWVRGTPGRRKWARSSNPVLRSAWWTERTAVRGAQLWRSAWTGAKRARTDYRTGADRAVLDRAHAQAIRENRFRGDPDHLPAPGPIHEPDRAELGPCVMCGTPTPWTTAEDGTPRLECSACSETFRADFTRPLTGLTYPPDQPGPAEPDRAGEPTQGAPVPDLALTIADTELKGISSLSQEVDDAVFALEQFRPVADWLATISGRFQAVPWGSDDLDAAVAKVSELAPDLSKIEEQLKEVTAALGELETAAERLRALGAYDHAGSLIGEG